MASISPHQILFITHRSILVTVQWRIHDFPEVGGANPRGGGWRQHKILPNFPQNCMKLKEFGPRGGIASKILQCRAAIAVITNNK